MMTWRQGRPPYLNIGQYVRCRFPETILEGRIIQLKPNVAEDRLDDGVVASTLRFDFTIDQVEAWQAARERVVT